VLTREGTVALVLALGLAAGAVAAAVGDPPALSTFLGLITVPVALYAALAAPAIAVSLALGAAGAGVVVIGYWIYVLITALQSAN
jgi:hypothetical protein